MGEAGLSIFSHALGKQEREERRRGYFGLEFVLADFLCDKVHKHGVTYESEYLYFQPLRDILHLP